MASEKQIQDAFLKAAADIATNTRFNALRDAIGRGDYVAALAAVDIEDASFDKVRVLVLETYAQGGIDAINGVNWPVQVRWNSATPQTERFAREFVGADITKITEDSRAAVRWTIGDGIAYGRSSNRIALDIVGRVGKSGAREGGIVGLNQQQAEWVSNARRYLEAGDYAAYNRMGLRDKRFRFSAENPPSQAQIDRAIQQYSNRMLLSRGKTIARTERGRAVNMGVYEGYRQGSVKTGIPLYALEKEWLHNGMHVHERMTHVAASGQRVRGLETPFSVGVYSPRFPHDPTLPASEVINCDCRFRVRVPKNWRSYVG